MLFLARGKGYHIVHKTDRQDSKKRQVYGIVQLVFRNREQMNLVQRSAVYFILVFTLLDVVFMFPCCDEVLSLESTSAVFAASNSEPHSSNLASDNCLCCTRLVLARELTLASSGSVRLAADARGIILLPAPPETHFHPPRPA